MALGGGSSSWHFLGSSSMELLLYNHAQARVIRAISILVLKPLPHKLGLVEGREPSHLGHTHLEIGLCYTEVEGGRHSLVACFFYRNTVVLH